VLRHAFLRLGVAFHEKGKLRIANFVKENGATVGCFKASNPTSNSLPAIRNFRRYFML